MPREGFTVQKQLTCAHQAEKWLQELIIVCVLTVVGNASMKWHYMCELMSLLRDDLCWADSTCCGEELSATTLSAVRHFCCR
jgi:hypothetical protein